LGLILVSKLIPYCYTHHTYNHGHGNFCHDLDSTSRIESIWAEIKASIKKYHKIPSKNFIYYLIEAKYRRKIKKLNFNEKLFNLSILFSYIGNCAKGYYLSEYDLISFGFEIMFDN